MAQYGTPADSSSSAVAQPLYQKSGPSSGYGFIDIESGAGAMDMGLETEFDIAMGFRGEPKRCASLTSFVSTEGYPAPFGSILTAVNMTYKALYLGTFGFFVVVFGFLLAFTWGITVALCEGCFLFFYRPSLKIWAAWIGGLSGFCHGVARMIAPLCALIFPGSFTKLKVFTSAEERALQGKLI